MWISIQTLVLKVLRLGKHIITQDKSKLIPFHFISYSSPTQPPCSPGDLHCQQKNDQKFDN